MSRADEMVQLRGEIERLRGARATFVEHLEQGVKDMQAGFRDAHNEMSERQKETFARQKETLATNEAGRQQDAQEQRAERLAFVDNVKQTVADLRERCENAAAHEAWFGDSPVEHQVKGRKEARPGTEANKPRKRRTR
jgi:hypothetical protein